MRLLGVEIRRILYRVMVIAVALFGLAGVVLTVVGISQSLVPLTPEVLADAERQYEFAVEDWEENHQEWEEECLEERERQQESGEDVTGWICEMEAPQREWYIPQSPELDETLPMFLGGTSMLLALVALVIGVTSTAAEMSTGAMGTWLTFVPQRMRVLASKIAAVVAVTAPLTAVLIGLVVLGLYLAHARADLTNGMDGAAWGDTAVVAARIVGLGALAGGLGAAFGVLLRHTGAALGVLLGYLALVEGMVRGLIPATQPYLLSLNMQGFVQGKASYWVTTCTVTSDGTLCEGVEKTIGLTHASVYLAAVSVALLTVTALVFRRRDIS